MTGSRILIVFMTVLCLGASLGQADDTPSSHAISSLMRPQTNGQPRGRMFSLFDIKGRLIDRRFFGAKPTLVIVAAALEDKDKIRKFYKEFNKTAARETITEMASTGAFSRIRKAICDRRLGHLDDLQLIVLMDPRALWENAFEKDGPQEAREKRPIVYGLVSRFPRLKARVDQRRVYPEVIAIAEKKYAEAVVPLEQELSENLSENQYRVGRLISFHESKHVFPSLVGNEPRFRVMVLETDGTVAESWEGDNINGSKVAERYFDRLKSQCAESNKLEVKHEPPK